MLLAGRILLFLAFFFASLGVVAAVYGAIARKTEFVVLARRAVYVVAGAVTLAFIILEVAFVRSDFSFAVVASHSSTTTPTFYRLTAMWSSQEGSLLLWLFLLCCWSTIFVATRRSKKSSQETPGERVQRDHPSEKPGQGRLQTIGQSSGEPASGLHSAGPWQGENATVRAARASNTNFWSIATAVLLVFAAFFSGLLVFLESPFSAAAPGVQEGVGLNPLLRHPSMMFHPPMLYSGYTLFTVPFALAVASLVTGKVGSEWIRFARPFALGAWLALGVGIILGARWSYAELGWGGYWAWDPVENAALLPWLTGTAFLHSALIQEKRGMLKRWNLTLILLTGILAILGTFLVRSGILNSIHAFGASTLGVPFLIFIAVLIVSSAILVAIRSQALRSVGRLDSILSREGIFLLNNFVLVGLCFVVFWGTFFPLISEAFTGTSASIGPPWFDRYVTPLALLLVVLSGIGPIIDWRRTTVKKLFRALIVPSLVAGAIIVGVLAANSHTGSQPMALTLFALAGFVVSVVVQEFIRGARTRSKLNNERFPVALFGLIKRNQRRYGGYIIHVGVAVTFVGIAASSAFEATRDVRLKPGQQAAVGGYQFKYKKATAKLVPATNRRLERIDFGAQLELRHHGKAAGTINTERSYFPSSDQALGPLSRFFEGEATTEVGLRAGFFHDVWTAITPDLTALRKTIREGDRVFTAAKSLPEDERSTALVLALRGITRSYAQSSPVATFRLIISPLVTWIWIGAMIVFAGALLALWPMRKARRKDPDFLSDSTTVLATNSGKSITESVSAK